MATLNIKLNQEYKSFPNGFEVSLEGDLIVISGVNGSGKSQLMEIIKGYSRNNPDKIISAEKSLNGVHLENGEVLYKSLTNSLGGGNIGTANPQNFNNYKDQIWNYYSNYKLDENNSNLREYQKSCKEAKKKMIDKFGLEKFKNNQITRLDLNDPIFSDFIWQSDDTFSNGISDIFYKYASDVQDLKASRYIPGSVVVPIDFEEEIGVIPPWKQLNGLFILLRIDYRFKENYELKKTNIEQPRLYSIGFDGEIVETDSREVGDLSDGEKVIISLIFSSLGGIDSSTTKIVVLDEFDATFNPSLTEMFYKVIDEYFVKNGIMVIIITHSPTTISLAPENTSFYEVFKKGQEERILPVQKEQYNELKIANREFYEKIGTQATRIEELKAIQERFESLQTKIEQSQHNLILTEGKTDWKHMKIALKKLQENGEFTDLNSLDFIEYEDDLGDTILCNYCIAESKKGHANKVICIFDRDNSNILTKVEDEDIGYKHWGNNLYSFGIAKPSHREFDNVCIEHYYSDEDLQTVNDDRKRLFLGTEFHGTGNAIDGTYQTSQKHKCNKNTIIDDNVFLSSDLSHSINVALTKNDFSQIVDTFDVISFQYFRPLFEKIRLICNPTI